MLEAAIQTPLRTAQSSSIISGLGTYQAGDPRSALAGPRFSHFRRQGLHLSRQDTTPGSIRGAHSATARLHSDLQRAASRAKAAEVICEAIMDELARLLVVAREELSPRKAMAEQGLDSLVAVQMRAWVLAALEAQVSALELLANMSVKALAGVVAERSKLVKGRW
ncbi:hypothetical protein MMC13_002319 [Lambiella insularis]|nr:hypothetical protein [Lambiella insularis]